MKLFDIAQELVGFHTVSDASTVQIGDRISDILSASGFQVEQHTYDMRGVRKINVIARKGPEGLPEIALTGHYDTVPYDPREWKSDPLTLTERDGKLYGRGACDMKVFVALAMHVGMRIATNELKKPFALIFTSDEEVGCIGARRLVKDRGALARSFVIGEPTGLVPFNMHKGYIYLRIKLQGVGGHSSRPAEGVNVVTRALPMVLTRLDQFSEALRVVRDDRFDPPYPTLNVGVVKTGDNAAKNTIAEYVEIELDIRPLPGQRVEDVVHALTRHIAPDGEINGVSVIIEYARSPTMPFETRNDAGVVQLIERLAGHQAVSTSFNTEGGVFNLSGGESVICGLGHIAQAHRPNEFVDTSFLSEKSIALFERVIREVCC